MLGNWQVQWLNLNSQRRYPLADDATGLDDSGSFQLPDDFLVELDLAIHAGMDVDPARFFVHSVGAYATGYSIVIAYQPATGDPVDVATASVPRTNFARNKICPIGGIEPFQDAIGKVVIGRLENIDQQPPGIWTFTLETARLDPDAVRPLIRGISSIACVNGDQVSVPLVGDIRLVAGGNMRISTILVAGEDPVIKFSAVSGEGTIDNCVCEGESAPTDPIKRINGVLPTNGGDLTIVGSQCISVEPIPNGIRISDTCAAPCCGCKELERITTDLENFGSQAASVQAFTDRLLTEVQTMSLTVLGAKIGDAGCASCT